MKKIFLVIHLFLASSYLFAQEIENYIDFVNPLIGTQNMGHTFPGATAPFGMVQLSPETNQVPMYNAEGQYNKKTYEYCAGYQYGDSTIFGFAHTHMSGTGHADLGDFLIMPTTGELTLDPGTADQKQKGYHSSFRHETEKATPGYYEVVLDDYNIKAQLTATERVGYHKYTFNKTEEAHIILDLMSNIYNHDDKNVWSFVRVENDSTVVGYRQTHGWARTRYVYFAMRFSKPIKNYGHKKYDKPNYNGFYRKFDEEHNFPEMAGKQLRAYFDFDVQEGEAIDVKFALSAVSTEGAMLNLTTEVPGWGLDKVKHATQIKWNNELQKIDVKVANKAQKETFYTAMYHSMLSPVIYEDVDQKYRGLDQNIYTSDGFTNYTIFSLWDTYRALHPLFNLIQPERNNDMIKSMLAHQDQSIHHMLPIWSHYSNENWCMVGYHAVTVLADAVAKNTTDADLKRMLEASKATSTVRYFDGIGEYIDLGYVPEDKSNASVSKTLEYAYNDWCIAQLAKANGDDAVEEEYTLRSKYYKNVFDKEINYMRPKLSDGSWRDNFDPLDTHGQGFIEGNAWNYGLYVPHEVENMIEMMGGKDQFSQHLDKIFTTEIEDKYIEHHEDITRDGIIGNYVHGNEPGHHMPYLYNWTNDAWKTQERVRMILDTMYSNDIDGLCGNDDAGQMSAWYIFSSLGFYPVLPGSADYAIGSPLVEEATIQLDNGKTLSIVAKNQSSKNVYVKKVILNGKEVKGNTLNHNDLAQGGTLIFEMSKRPKKK
ncbi:GH92 family glycosyl hydrolase [Flammeovirga pacifica]|uniref:Sugar hydrolase n=1 Tax=Flammeovirga pacifica TaxID=915059 RepID=A0A1S1YS13_FLAPC|nr:GH92 family glycosyl hydrolase [Flammeovirga pacifica]OHX63829.1 sugar hydrolase [Flammeovirga pacifica]